MLLQHRPTETATLENYSATTACSIGGNIGFFGEVPTGGISGSYSFSETHSWSTPSVSVTDRTGTPAGPTVVKVFNMNTDAQKKAPFQTLVNEVFQLPDEKFGDIRSLEKTGAKMKFEISFIAEHDISTEDILRFPSTRNTLIDWVQEERVILTFHNQVSTLIACRLC